MLYDKDIREPLFDFLEDYFGKVRILEEKKTGRSRADLVMILPRQLAGIEIKSDADTYQRLSRQVKDYNEYYDINYVVVGSSHALHIEEHVPDWWGIITVELMDGRVDFYVLRKAKDNPQLNLKKKLTILWRPELALIQEMNHLPQYKEKSKAFVIEKLIQKLPRDRLDAQICDVLFERDYTTIEKRIKDYKRARKSKLKHAQKHII